MQYIMLLRIEVVSGLLILMGLWCVEQHNAEPDDSSAGTGFIFVQHLRGFFSPVLSFRDLLFIYASTNATDDHKYSLLPSADFDSSEVLASQALSKPKGPFFRENEAQEMTPKLLALAKVCSVLGNIRDVSWHLSKRGSELEKR